jgi:YfiH family protein
MRFNKKVKFGFSDSTDGQMKIEKTDLSALINRKKFIAKQISAKIPIISSIQKHTSRAKFISSINKDIVFKDYDALLTSQKDIVLTLSFADCFPIYFYNTSSKIIGIAHCGWRGSINRLLPNCLKYLKPFKTLKVYVGPGIQKCHFEVKEDVLSKFCGYKQALVKQNFKYYVDLPRIIKNRIILAGVSKRNIKSSNVCTYCSKDKYFSFRRDKPKKVKAMMGYICIN